MRLVNSFLLYYCLLFSHLFVFGQYLPSKNYSTSDGLPNNAVRALFVDSKSVLWIGTENGVSRMENGSFFNLDESDGLAHNSCWDINQDRNGNLWFASYGGGVSKFDGNKFTIFTTKNGLSADKTRKVFPYKNKIYVGTEAGISIIDINTNKIIIPKKAHPDFGVFIVSDFFTYKGEVYFSTVNEGLFKVEYSATEAKIVHVFKHKNVYSLGHFGSTLYSSNKGFVNTFNLEDINKGFFSSATFGQSIVWQYAKDKRNVIYASAWGIFDSSGGLYKISNNQMVNISDYYGIHSKNLLNVVYDKTNDILYVGSKDKGIYEVRLDQMIDYDFFEGKAIVDFENIYDGNIILHQDGVSLLNAKNKTIKTIKLPDFKKIQVDFIKKAKKPLPTHEDGFYELNYDIPSNGIEFYEIVKQNKSFWITSNIGIFEINKELKIIGYLPIHSYKIGFTAKNQFIETIPYAGVRVYDDCYSLKGKHYSISEKHTPQYIVKILNHNDKTYLLSVFNGLYVHENNKFKSYLAEGIWKESKFKHVTVNNKGQLILSAEFGEVFIVDDSKKFKVLKTISKKEIIGNSIMFLEAYKDYILIGTEKGINIYRDGKIRLIDQEQGLKDCVVTTSQIINNQLWLGTQKGYYTLDLKRLIQEPTTVSKLEISNIAVNNVPIEQANFNWFRFTLKELIFDYKHNSFSIDFVPKGHTVANKLKFRYRLKSTNRWSPYSEKPNLFLPYLPYGKYDVEVEVFDLNAGKSTVFKLLKIIIQPPFWMTLWFVTLFILGVLGTSFHFILGEKNRSKEKAVIQKRIAETKLEALLSQMNPHFTFNAMNAIQDYIISNDVDNSLLYIGEFSKLMRKTLENSSKQTIAIEEEIDYLKSYITIENMRFDNRIDCQFQIAPEVDVCFCKIPTMLLQPFVENVFVHAFDASHPNPKLTISFEMVSENILECKIIDNGKGLKESQQTKVHKSKGIELTKERLTLFQGTSVNPITILHTEKEGTIVTIRLIV